MAKLFALVSKNKILFTTSVFEADRRRLTEKLRGMAKLQRGWSHGRGIPVSEFAIIAAEEFIFLIMNLELHADVFPDPDGGCAVAFYKDEDRVEVSIAPDGKHFGLRVEHGIGFQFSDVIPPKEHLGLDEILRYLLRLKMLDDKAIWKLSASSISASSTGPASDSAMLYTETRQTQLIPRPLRTVEGGSQSLKPLVLAQAKA